MEETKVFEGLDHVGRQWAVTARPYKGQQIVNFRCFSANAKRKALDQTTAWWFGGWDLSRPWLPRSPMPVPEAVLMAVVKVLKALPSEAGA